MKKIVLVLLIVMLVSAYSQPWQQNDLIFNPSGIPSLPFSQPRFADLDADGDYDMILGSIDDAPVYFENTGTKTNPKFQAGPDLFSVVTSLDAEMGVCKDLDGDGDLDLVTGGYTGLNYFENNGDSSQAVFQKINNFFNGLVVGANPVPAFADLDADGDYDMVMGLSEDGHIKYYPNTGTPQSASFLEGNT